MVLKLYHNALKKKEFYFIFFFLSGAKGDEWMELYLPIPNVLIYPKGKNGVFIGYFVEGFFATQNNKKFLQDIIKRFEKTFLKLSNIGYVERITHPPILDNKVDFRLQIDKIYSLKDFSRVLDSLDNYISKKQEQIQNLKIAKAIGERKITDDALFDYMRFIAYDFVKMNGKEALTREYLEKIGELGNEVLGKTKEPSTIRAKAKSIYNWIMEKFNPGSGVNNWNYKRKLSDEEYEMTRKEIALRNSKMRAKKTKEKVYKAIEELRKKGETISIKNIIKISDVGYNSAQKYLRQAREEGLI